MADEKDERLTWLTVTPVVAERLAVERRRQKRRVVVIPVDEEKRSGEERRDGQERRSGDDRRKS